MPQLTIQQANDAAVAMLRDGRVREAESLLRQVLGYEPNEFTALLNLGTVLLRTGRLDGAAELFGRAIELRPGHPGGHLNLGFVYRRRHRVDDALASFRRAVELDPTNPQVHQGLGSTLREAGLIREAIASFREAVRLNPRYQAAHSNLVYALHFDPDVSEEELLAEHVRWAERFAEPLAGGAPHGNVADPERRLRVGYVSPNLGENVVGQFMIPVLRGHDRERFEVFCYSDAEADDGQSRLLRGYVPTWRETRGLSDEQLAAQVRADGIDVLVDLTLHMRGSRLGAFARKPAPVQATYLAYCGTSGMRQMDWCVADEHLVPSSAERFFTERVARLDGPYWCYEPPADAPDVAPLPALGGAGVTFGSFNALAKVNDQVLATWAELLRAVPNARLLLHAVGGVNGQPSLMERLKRLGLPTERVEIIGYAPYGQYLTHYHRVDVALDPFPYNGGTTTLDALYLGVPVVTLAGTRAVGRAGVTILGHVGLSHLVAATTREYVEIATKLAGNLDSLASLRSGLRGRLRASALMVGAGHARALESVYRQMWRAWCASRGGGA